MRHAHPVGIRLDAALQLIDAFPFEVSSAPASDPIVMATPNGTTIAYSRDDNGVTRLFTRTLDRAGLQPRRRVIH